MDDLKMLVQFAVTGRQKEIINACIKEGGQNAAARKLGLSTGTVSDSLKVVRRHAALRGYDPTNDAVHPVALGQALKGITTLYDSEGGIKHQYVKSDRVKGFELEIAGQIYTEMSKTVKRLAPRKAPTKVDTDLLNLYPMTDAHIGMMAWRKEGGRDWDLKIAEEVLIDAFMRMIERSDPAHKCVIGQLGDFLHFDGIIPVTPMSGHVLDVDGRYSKVVDVAIKVMRHTIDAALSKHKEVHVVIAEGNHDIASSVWLRKLVAALYENEPRLTVNASERPYYVYQHGKVMLAFHHGHLKNDSLLPGLFASTESKMWGETDYRYGHTGHKHSDMKLARSDTNGMLVTRHPILGAKDSYASRHGYDALSNVTATTYHKEYGEWGSITVVPKR
jgi:hypothetical protein